MYELISMKFTYEDWYLISLALLWYRDYRKKYIGDKQEHRNITRLLNHIDESLKKGGDE